jgi:four helix bundle protein
MFRFEELITWKKSAALSVDICRKFDNFNDYGFKNQITRSGLSISSNIAEGYERLSQKELRNFLNYAKGSAGELISKIYMGMKIDYIDGKTGRDWIKKAEEISKMLQKLLDKFKPE